MHVVIVTTSYPDRKPGSEAAGGFVADFASCLAQHVQVTVIAAARQDSVTREGDLDVVRFGVPRVPLSLLRPLDPRDWLAILRTILQGKRALNAAITDRRPDHVLALWALPSGYWARHAMKRSGVPYSVWALGSDVWSLGRLPVLRSMLREIFRDARICFADGFQLAQDVEEIAGRDCRFLASSRHLPKPGRKRAVSSPPYRLAFLGRWHANKGIDLLLDALARLTDDDWQKIEAVRICGGGPLQHEVNRRGNDLANNSRPVEIGGFLGRDAAAELIEWADFLVLPSRIESIPVVFSDAVQLGTPLIATPVGDLPRLFERHRFGVLANEASAECIERAIRDALDSDPQSFSQALDTVAAEFDVSRVAHQFATSLSDQSNV